MATPHPRGHQPVHRQVYAAEANGADAPAQQAAPPQPHPVAVLKILKTAYRNWITAGGTPPIYNLTPPNQSPPYVTPKEVESH